MTKKKVKVVEETVAVEEIVDGGYKGIVLDNGDIDFTRSDI